MKKLVFVFFLLSSLIIASCAGQSQNETTAPISDNRATNPVKVETPAISPSETATVEPDHSTTPTADSRLTPENWQNWPVIPEVSDTVREIYARGIEMGNDPHAFSKVGDCQNLKPYFLGKFDHLSIYTFDFDLEPYLDTIENFKGHFYRDGQAAVFGFTAASPLSQLLADPDYCNPGETPLECELRLTSPTFVAISLEFPFLRRTPELYEQYIRKIIEYTMSQGAVPILATKADNVEKDHSINYTTAKLAYEYDLPLWNWWLAAQIFPDKGIDTGRDGFHITKEAWDERSNTFLFVLDHIWKELRETPQ